MKRIFSIFFSLLMLIASSGFSLSIDYCSFQKKTSLSVNEEKSCCCRNKQMPNNCCNQKKITLEKIKDNYTPSSHLVIPLLQLQPVLFFHPTVAFSLPKSLNFELFERNQPPPDLPVRRNILYRSLLI